MTALRRAIFGHVAGAALLLSLSLLLLPPSAGQGVCNESTQAQALLDFYSVSGGSNWTERAGWGTSDTCTRNLTVKPNNNATFYVPIPLPSHCCWQGVSCCLFPNISLSLGTRIVECGSFQCNCTENLVTGLSLGRNNVRGDLTEMLAPSIVAPLSCSLRAIFLSGNGEGVTGLGRDYGARGVCVCVGRVGRNRAGEV